MEFQSKNKKYYNPDKNKRIGKRIASSWSKNGYKVLACSHTGLSKPGSHGPPGMGRL